MIKNDSIVNNVLYRYYEKQESRKYAYAAQREALLKNSEYADVKARLDKAIFDINKAEFNEDTEAAKKLEPIISDLKSRKFEMEKKNGVLSGGYDCPACKDTGEINGEKCNCFYENITAECYKELNVSPAKLVSFSDDRLSDINGTKKYFEKFLTYANNFSSSSRNIIFTGKTGTGKTFLSKAITEKIGKNKNIALFLTAADIVNIAIDNMYESPAVAKSVSDIIETCDFLVIDDLGAERMLNKITVENLYVIISRRQELMKPYLITTNLTLDELSARYGDRLFSRITSKNTVTITFDGADLRKI